MHCLPHVACTMCKSLAFPFSSMCLVAYRKRPPSDELSHRAHCPTFAPDCSPVYPLSHGQQMAGTNAAGFCWCCETKVLRIVTGMNACAPFQPPMTLMMQWCV